MKSKYLTGKITIQENIEILENNKIPRTFVAHIPNPLKAYYSRFTDINKPNSILLFTKGSFSREKIIRVTNMLNEDNPDTPIVSAKARVLVGNRTYHAIRLKGIRRFNHIEEIQSFYQNHGFEFEKNNRYRGEVNALVRIARFFNINRIDAGIFNCEDMDNVYYIEMPKPISWNEFSKITFEIKNNIQSPNYDVVKGMFYTNTKVVDFIRIMKADATIEQLKDIQERYWQKMVKLTAIDNLI